MAVLVLFRERRTTYPDGVTWKVDPATGRLTILGDNNKPVATYNTGVWDVVRFDEHAQDKKWQPSVTVNMSTSANSVDTAWNSTLTPSADVDFMDS